MVGDERITLYEGTGVIQFSRRWMLEAGLNCPGIRVPSRTGTYAREFYLEPSFQEFDLVGQMGEREEDDFTPRVDVEGYPSVFRDPSGRWGTPCSQWDPERYRRFTGKDPVTVEENPRVVGELVAPGVVEVNREDAGDVLRALDQFDAEVSALRESERAEPSRGSEAPIEGNVISAAEAIENVAKGGVVAEAVDPSAPVVGEPLRTSGGLGGRDSDAGEEASNVGTGPLASPVVSQDFRGLPGSPAWSGNLSISRGPVSDAGSYSLLSSLHRWVGFSAPDRETEELGEGRGNIAPTSRSGFQGTTVAFDERNNAFNAE